MSVKKARNGTGERLHKQYRTETKEVVLAPQKVWVLVPHFIWDRYVYTFTVPCPKMVSTVPKMCRAVPIYERVYTLTPTA